MTSLPGYDEWKLASPDDDLTDRCPVCGAHSKRDCEEIPCSWEDSEPDPDHLRDIQNEDREFFDRREGTD